MFHVKHTYILCIYMMIFITITNMHTKSMAAQDLKNLFNHMYYADGWAWNVYNVDTGAVESYPGIYPQAPVNFMLKVSYRF